MNEQPRELLKAMRRYLYLPDPDYIYFTLAVAVSARLEGDPLWGLLVGAPSSGKTEAIRVFDDVADEHLSDISAAGLMSWTPGKRARKTGLLTRIGPVAFATIADLSTLLSASDRGQRDLLYALLRRAYDGEVVRELGNAPEPLVWRGRLTLLAAVTPAVDNFSSHSDALGPRWLYCRLPQTDTEARRRAVRMAREAAPHLERHRASSRAVARAVVDAAASEARAIRLSESVAKTIDDAALVACLGRAAVEREGYGARGIVSLPTIEEPPRLIGQLALLARALLSLGLDATHVAAISRRAALDSMPQVRRRVLAMLATDEELVTAEIARRIGADRKVATMALQELAAIGVCRYRGDDQDAEEPTQAAKYWRLEGPDAELIAAVMGSDGARGTKCGSPTSDPPLGETGAPHASAHRPAVS